MRQALHNIKSGYRQHRQAKPGQTLVEFALVGIILFAFLMGIMDAARLLFTYSVVSNAAQEGSHYMIIRPRDVINPTDATRVAGLATRTPTALRIVYAPEEVITPDTACSAFNKTRENAWGLTRSQVDVTAWYDDGSGTPIALSTATPIRVAARPGNRAVVEASYQFDFVSPYMKIFVPNGITVKMRSARTILSAGDVPTNCGVNYTPAPTYTSTATNTPTSTGTSTFTSTPTVTNTPTVTRTPTSTGTATRTSTGTATMTGTVTATPTFVCPLRLTNITALRATSGGNNGRIQLRITVTDQGGRPITNANVGATVGLESLTLSNIPAGSNTYGICTTSTYATNQTVTFTVDGAGCTTVTQAVLSTSSGSLSCP